MSCSFHYNREELYTFLEMYFDRGLIKSDHIEHKFALDLQQEFVRFVP